MLKKIGLVLGFFVVSVSAILFYVFASTADATEIVDRHFHLVHDGKMQEAYDQTTTDNFRNETSFADFSKMFNNYFMLRDVETSDFPERKIENNNYATLTGTLSTKNDLSLDIEVELTKVKRNWLIEKYHITNLTMPAGQDPQDTLDTYTDLLLAGKLQESYEYFSLGAQEQTAWADYQRMFSFFPYIYDLNFQSKLLTDYDKFVATGMYQFNDGTYTIGIALSKKDSAWHVDSVQTGKQE